MLYLRYLLFGALCLLKEVTSEGFYTILAPKVLRPNTEYHVAVSIQKTPQPTTVAVTVGGKQLSGGVFQTSQTVTVEPYVTRIIKLEIGDLGPGSYNLTARGINGLVFENTTTLEYVHKSYSVFIQTDKAIYKPGQKIQFRAVVLNALLKPSVTGALDIYITDGEGNRVKQWNRALTTKGVFSGELQLSEHPVLGDWNITVLVLGQTFSKSFQVAEYVLPKFEVTIDAPQHATFKDSRIAVTVRAKYTYGKPVKGEATVTSYPTYYSGLLQPIFQNPVRKVVPIDGKAIVEFDIVKELQLGDEFERSIQIDVVVEEALTGRRQNNTAQLLLHKHKYKMDLIKTSDYFKPGLKYTAFVKLAYHDGAPVQDDKNPLVVRYGYTYDQNLYKEENHKISKNGLVELNFYPPADSNLTVIGIEADYLDLKEWFSTVSAAMSPSNSFIQAVIKTEHPVVNQDVEIEVNSTAPMKYFSYQIIGRGDVVLANTVQVPDMKSHTFRFLATYAMAPTAHIVIFYVRDDGEVVADALDIELEGSLQNFVNIDLAPSKVEPGANVDLTVEAKPNSYVGLLGIDQSVLLLKSGNDITKEAVLEELKSYDGGSYSPYWPMMRNFDAGQSFFWWPGSATAKEVFDNSGSVILTNGYVHEHFPFGSSRDSGLIAQNRPPFRPIPAPGQPVVKPDLGPPVVFRPVTRPPLAGPYAFSRIPTPVWNRPRVYLMHDIASTWLFSNISSGFDGKASIRKPAPDTITSWVITGFSVDPVYGLGLTKAPRKLQVFRPFFISINLPYSVIRGEIVAIPIIVFNYMDKDLQADVTLENPQLENFEFADVSNDVNDQPKLELYRRKRVTVQANSGTSVSFMIVPKKLGYVTIKATATSSLAGDAVERKLLVKAEGETQYHNKAMFVDLRNTNLFASNVTLDFPPNVVAGSEAVEISVVGDILGPSIPNLANLIKMPFGCGEQNMLNFVPNIVIIEYLKNTNQLTPAVESKALKYIETGYQQELTYRHSDGSFSAFGMSDPSGSTWLTAFVAKSFRQAMPYINMEEKVIQEALAWLASNQAANGSFPEVGKVSHRDMQGGAAKGLALTAYALIAFLEDQSTQLYRNAINKALDYIVRNMDGLDDIYAITISTYALNLAQHSYRDTAFQFMESKAQSEGDMKWWAKPIDKGDEKNPWHSLPNSISVETTAYALLTYLQRGLVQDALPIMKWLVTQRNENGGFASTQDTVIGISALAKLAERIRSNAQDVSIKFSYPNGSPVNFKVNQANAMILQKQEVPGRVREMNISASGTGFAILQVSYRYNVNVTGAWPLFTLDPQVDKNSDSNHLQLSICSGFVGVNAVNESNMAVMEVTLPSGFTVDSDSLPSLEVSQNVKRVETKDGDTVVVLYFDKVKMMTNDSALSGEIECIEVILTVADFWLEANSSYFCPAGDNNSMVRQEYCPTVSAFRTHKVAKQKPVPVTIYDYYDSSRRARVFYEPRVATLCDICEDEDCTSACSSKPRSRSDDGKSAASAVQHISLYLWLVLLALVAMS